MSIKKLKTKQQKEDFKWIRDNWKNENPYNWYDKYGKWNPTLEEIVEKYSEDEARSILIMIKILHDTNTQIKTLIKNADSAEGMVGPSIVYRLSLYRLLDQFYAIPMDGVWDDEDHAREYLKYIAKYVFYRERRDHPMLLFYSSEVGSDADELYQIISSDDKDHDGNRWFRGIDPNKKGEFKIYIRSVKRATKVRAIDPFRVSVLQNWFLIPKNLDFNHKDLYPEDLMTDVPEGWEKYDWPSLRQVAQRKMLTTESFSGLTRMTPWGDKPHQNQLQLRVNNNRPTTEATLSNVFKKEYTPGGKKSSNPTYRYYNSCTLCGYILPDKPDVDHVFNLFLNSLLNIDSSAEGYSDTCAACNRFFKRDRVFNLRRDTWRMFLDKAGWKEDEMDWGRPPTTEDSFDIGESYEYRYDGFGDDTKPEILSRTGHTDGYDINYITKIPVIPEDVLEDFYIRRILYLIKNNDVVKGILRPLMSKLASVKSEHIQECVTSILKKFNEDLNNIKIAASGLLAGQKILTAARGSDWSPNTKKRLSSLSGVGRVFAARDIREGNVAAVRKGQRLQLMKNQQVLKKKATSSANTFDPLTTDRLAWQYDVAPPGGSQTYDSAYSKALGKEKHSESIRNRIRDHGFTTNAKRGLEVAENEKVYVDGITAQDLKARKVWCEE